MPGSARYLLCYDISSKRERDKVCEILEGFGSRVQKSVFELHLTTNGKKDLVDRLKQLSISSGTVRIYRIHSSANSDVIAPNIEDDSREERSFTFIS